MIQKVQKDTHGNLVAAPVAGQILSEVLPYLQIASDGSYSTSANSTKTLPNVTNKTIAEAKKILEKSGFTCSTSGESSDIVTEQYPAKGSELLDGSVVKLYTEKQNTRVSVQVPDLINKNLSQVKNLLKEKNLNLRYSGSGIVLTQDPIANTSVEEGTVINIRLGM